MQNIRSASGMETNEFMQCGYSAEDRPKQLITDNHRARLDELSIPTVEEWEARWAIESQQLYDGINRDEINREMRELRLLFTSEEELNLDEEIAALEADGVINGMLEEFRRNKEGS